MKKIYILYDEISETVDMSYSENVKRIREDKGKLFPAFLTKKDAQKFIDENIEYFKPKILELTIYKGE